MKLVGFRWITRLYALALLSGVAASGQQSAPYAPSVVAPVPPLLLSAKKVFISNAGADSGLFPHPFAGDPDRAYNEFLREYRELGPVSGGRCA
jgi:hypothetical protein